MMKTLTCLHVLLLSVTGITVAHSDEPSKREIMESLELDSRGKTEVVKDFPDSFPEVLTARGKPIIYTKRNSDNFEYIGMPIGGICAGQLYLGGDGKLWFWDIFNVNFRKGQLKGEEAYEFPYVRSRPDEKGARSIQQGFSIRVKSGDRDVTKSLDRDGIRKIEFLGQYPIGEVTYRDPELPVEVMLEAFSPFVPLDLDRSILPATVMSFTIKNTSTSAVEAELSGWLENAVLTESRGQTAVKGRLLNRVTTIAEDGLRLECSAVPAEPREQLEKRPEILFEDFEHGYKKWKVSGDAFRSNGEPYYHHQPLKDFAGKRLADSMNGDRQRHGDKARGKLTSPPFKIERSFVSCLIGGGNHRGHTCVNVLVDGKVIATATGNNSEALRQVKLDVARYEGRQAVIEIVDDHSGDWGHVLVDQLVFTDRFDEPIELTALPDFGTMSLALLGGSGTQYASPEEHAEQSLADATPPVGRLGKRLQLEPGAEKTVTFLITWHFPTTRALAGKNEQRYYASRFENAFAVSDYLVENLDELAATTKLWRDTWYDSTLPYWFLDRTFLNTSILASSTSNLLRDRLFYGWEGAYQGAGTCTHVWGYVQAMGRLFPELEKSLREQVDFRSVGEGGALKEDGIIKHRWFTSHELAVDGQSGCILKAYLCHQVSRDDAFLRRVYPGVKKAMQGLTEARDPNHDGILTGPQHNTLDAAWYGKVTWLSLHYTAALRAMALMADEMGDREYASFCRVTADKGRQYIEDELFTGEYFIHEADPEKPDSPGTYTGLEYSQLLGQSWAYQVAMGQIVDPVKAKTALESMWRYNFTTDVGPFRQTHEGGRWYAMPREGGLIACTWPNGGTEALLKGNRRFANYNNECQNGYEYAATSLMMWHGMPYHSLAHIWYMHNDRYHGSKRNPWCEVEWGLHYSRSMASYGHFTAVCGFEYHGPRGHIAFSPRITPEKFKAAFTSAEGWGSFQQSRAGKTQTNIIDVKYGRLELETLALDVAETRNMKEARVFLAGKEISEITFEQKDNRVTIDLSERILLTEGHSLRIELR